MPIEVPDTRAFADPPPRRRRTAAKTAAAPAPDQPAEALVPEQTSAPEPASAFRKPVRRPRAAAVVEAAVVETPTPPAPAEATASSAFSRPVRRRPRTDAAPAPAAGAVATLAEPAPVAEPTRVPVPDAVPASTAVAEPVAHAAPEAVAPAPVLVEERRGTEGVAEEHVAVTDTVVVRLGGTRYAVPMDAVAEVGRPPHVTRVPGVPAWIAGVANWRGRIMPVLDLRILLGAPSPELGVTGRIMVLARDGITLAFLAERVEGVVSLELESLEPVLLTLSRTTASVLAGQLTHPDGPIALLDLDMVFGLRSALPRVRRAG